jgi:indole-3-glycerol phosphate synthase
LNKIVQHKRQEIQKLIAVKPLSNLANDYRLKNNSISMKSALMNGSGVIAEFKRASPSRGLINAKADVLDITQGYQSSGVSAISVLTDNHFFGALADDFTNTRENVDVPILRKDFTIDPYQIYQAKIMGADCILLIAAILTADEIKHFIKLANDLGMDSIIEVHNHTELDKLSGNEKIIGVNNRNLDTFEVDIETSLQLANQLGDVLKITESGLGIGANLKALVEAGYNGFLVGEGFMKEKDPKYACGIFVDKINQLKP